jgi:hydroxymethylglutaryl-CoA lyase
MRNEVILHEVGMRDGLQMEKQTVSTEQKLKWIKAMIDTGVDIIQVGSFVNPSKVPQMADTDQLFADLASMTASLNVVFSALVLNEKGLERALAKNVGLICMGVSASETHSRKNTGMSIAEATQCIIAMAKLAIASKKKVQVSIQSAFGCGYEGRVPQERVMRIVELYLHEGLRIISLADTAGHAMPDQVEKMFNTIMEFDEAVECACHFHNTYGTGLANCYAAMRSGVKYFESSIAGLGGCPFTEVAGGNVCTEDFVHMLQRMGLRHDVKLNTLINVAKDVGVFLGREMPGTVYKVGAITEREFCW